MEHQEAIRTRAVERYLLGEMLEDEQAAFEEHYFDCRVCAADVTEETRLLVAGRGVAAEPSNVVPMRLRWFPAAAAASLIFGLLGTGAGYRVALWQERQSELLQPPVQIETGTSRAGAPGEVKTVSSGGQVRFDVPPHDDAMQYASVITCGGEIQSTHLISRKRAAEEVFLDVGELPAGPCELVIEGVRKDGNRFEITSSPFEVLEGE